MRTVGPYLAGWIGSLLVAICAGAAIQNILLGQVVRAALPSPVDWLPILVAAAFWTAAIAATLTCAVLAAVPRLTASAFRSLLAGLVLGALAGGLWCAAMPPRTHQVTVIDTVEGQPARVSPRDVPLPAGTWPPFGPDYARYLEAFAAVLLASLVWGGVARRRGA